MIDKIDLKILELTEKGVISGQELSSFFEISRTAIWKRIKKLEKLGYVFKHKKEGYKLVKRTDFLLENEIKPFLKTEKLGKNYIFFEEINSTSIYAKENDFENGTVIVAENQTAGKGRKGRNWISKKNKGLYFSIVLKPKLDIKDIMKFSLIFPLSILEVIRQENLNPKIKWPNDIYLNNKKVAGILIETEIESNDIQKIVVGIGININLSKEDLKEVNNIATSLYIEKGSNINRKDFFARLLKNIEENYFGFLSYNLDPIKIVEESLLWKNESVKIIDEKQEINGILNGLNELGGLKIKKENQIINLYSGDLSLRKF